MTDVSECENCKRLIKALESIEGDLMLVQEDIAWLDSAQETVDKALGRDVT